LQERLLVDYLPHECINRCLSLITNAEANIRINESFPKKTRLRELGKAILVIPHEFRE